MSTGSERTPPQLGALIALVFAEAALLVVATAYLAFELFTPNAQDERSAIALAVTTGLLAAGVAVIGAGLVRRWARIRGAVLTWEILQVACAVGAFEGLLGPSWIGWLLLAPAAAAIWLLFTRPVTAIFAAKDEARRAGG